MLWVTFLNWFYWVSGALCGWLIGGVLPFSTKGIGFAMTAMFLVIVLGQWNQTKGRREHLPVLVGFAVSLGCLLIFGSKDFMVPTLLVMLVAFIVLRPYLSELKNDGKDGEES